MMTCIHTQTHSYTFILHINKNINNNNNVFILLYNLTSNYLQMIYLKVMRVVLK